MVESLGARLRQQRERQQIVLATIAEQTKIGLPLLEALERDDVSRWPGGIFRRAFVRAYAQAVGLEPDVVVREFLAIHPDPPELVDAPQATPPAVDDARVSPRPQTRFRYVMRTAVSGLSRLRPGAEVPRGSADAGATAAELRLPKSERPPEPDLAVAAELCTELCQVDDLRMATSLLRRMAGVLDAAGLIVWLWDSQMGELSPTIVHGYSDRTLEQMPRVRRESDNVTATAFRAAQTCMVNGRGLTRGAVAVPLMTSAGCVGVFAVELHQGREPQGAVRALATIFAAQLSMLLGGATGDARVTDVRGSATGAVESC